VAFFEEDGDLGLEIFRDRAGVFVEEEGSRGGRHRGRLGSCFRGRHRAGGDESEQQDG